MYLVQIFNDGDTPDEVRLFRKYENAEKCVIAELANHHREIRVTEDIFVEDI